MELNIINEVAALQRLSVGQLRQRFAELFGETTKASNRTWLVKPASSPRRQQPRPSNIQNRLLNQQKCRWSLHLR